ncbi:hypothetical protein PSTG_10523 [Puccinia striiformis f. sp. tritici PST-78]|uniref:Replication factor C subunit 1 n=1 Tax=Puccinia striiformis f. sp. tritici PST-78 TaxID=1165861 RepID=A0A0L0V9Y3_9BASI|nr:hypothetical protein PSTG_10523 [Puccinia striiformis f. sp. tritici PST-78]
MAKRTTTEKPASSKAPATKKQKTDAEAGSSTTPAKPKWFPGKERAGPSAPGSKPIPEGKENCLAGLTFVFTGELESLSREDAQSLCKRYGGRVTTSPSSKTSYVVLGSDAGPKKLEMIKKHKIKTITEDEFLALIGSNASGEVDAKTIKKQEEEVKKVEQVAKSLGPAKGSVSETKSSGQLWTVKYAPKTLGDLCGNKTQIDKIQAWLHDWPKFRRAKFTKPGKDGLGMYRCVVLSGPPGVGKTSAAHLVAQTEGYEVIELNASDTRSKKLLETGFKDIVGNSSIAGFLETSTQRSEKLVLIMDEVDGMSAGDRGGVGALNALIRKSQIPIIAIANDMSTPKMKPLKATALSLVFRRPNVNMIRSRMMSIAFKEGMKIPPNVIDQLVEGSQSDIRQIINMLSTWKIGNSQQGPSKTMDFDQARQMTSENEKDAIMSPWTLMSKIFAPQTWSQMSSLSFIDKCNLYFHDHSMLPLFVQDGYVKHDYGLARNCAGQEKAAKKMELLSLAADSIADGDLVDRMIHGPQQHWSLMPLHGVFSVVRPAYFCHGPSTTSDFGGFSFPSWFGKNSTQGKLSRVMGEIHGRMRMKISGDKRETLMTYLPVLYPKLIDPLIRDGTGENVDQIIELMDDYYLTKEEWDNLVEVMAIGKSHEDLLKQIPSATKSAFTRKYNKGTHPIPFQKEVLGAAVSKKIKSDVIPDVEEIAEIDVEEEGDEDEKSDEESTDIAKDKLIKAKKPTRASGAAARATTKAAQASSSTSKPKPKPKSKSEPKAKPAPKSTASKARKSTNAQSPVCVAAETTGLERCWTREATTCDNPSSNGRHHNGPSDASKRIGARRSVHGMAPVWRPPLPGAWQQIWAVGGAKYGASWASSLTHIHPQPSSVEVNSFRNSSPQQMIYILIVGIITTLFITQSSAFPRETSYKCLEGYEGPNDGNHLADDEALCNTGTKVHKCQIQSCRAEGLPDGGPPRPLSQAFYTNCRTADDLSKGITVYPIMFNHIGDVLVVRGQGTFNTPDIPVEEFHCPLSNKWRPGVFDPQCVQEALL